MDDARIFPRALYDYEFGKSDWKKRRSLHFAAAGTIDVGYSERGAQDWVLSDCGDSSKIPNLSCIRRVVIGRRLSAPNRFQSTKYFGQSFINGIGNIVDVVGC